MLRAITVNLVLSSPAADNSSPADGVGTSCLIQDLAIRCESRLKRLEAQSGPVNRHYQKLRAATVWLWRSDGHHLI